MLFRSEDHEIFLMATQLVYCLRTESDSHLLTGFWKDVYEENRHETLEWMDSLDGRLGEKWREVRGELLAAQPATPATNATNVQAMVRS